MQTKHADVCIYRARWTVLHGTIEEKARGIPT